MRLRSISPRAALAAFAAVAFAVAPALAQHSDRADAERILGEVAPNSSASAAAREVSASQDAVKRAESSRGSADVKHAELLEGLAKTWAEAARDLLAAMAAEADAVATQQKVVETKAQLERERTLLEETISRRGRAKVELERAEADAAAKTPAPPPKEKPKKAGGGKKKDAAKGGKK